MVTIDSYHKRRKIVLLSLMLVSFLAFIIVSAIVISNDCFPLDIDTKVLNLIIENRGEKGGFTYYAFRIVTEFGYIFAAFFFGIILLIYTKVDTRGVCFIVGAIIFLILNFAVKNIIQRPRPAEELRWMVEDGYSFPSGHSLISGFMYSYFAFVFYKDKKISNPLKVVFMTVSILMIPCVMISRLILSVHYVSDVLGGMLLGLSLSFGMMLLNNFLYFKDYIKTPLLTLVIQKIKKNKKEDTKEENNQ